MNECINLVVSFGKYISPSIKSSFSTFLKNQINSRLSELVYLASYVFFFILFAGFVFSIFVMLLFKFRKFMI